MPRSLLAVLLALSTAAPAQAATVQKLGTELQVIAAAGESNRVKVEVENAQFVVRDPGNALAVGGGCSGDA